MRSRLVRVFRPGFRIVLVFLAAVATQSCYYLQPTGRPIETTYFPIASANHDAKPKDLLVMLPGIGDYPTAFQQNNFIEEMRRRKLPVDAVAVNAHVGYYSDRTLLPRLKKDVVERALKDGYQRIHFMGISLGGYGTLLYMRQYPDDVTSAILIAPYLGQPDHYNYLLEVTGPPEISESGGNLWPWLAHLPDNEREKIHLGYGLADQYSEGQELLSRYLPRENTMTVAGNHTWTTWQILLPQMLARVQFIDKSGATMAGR